MGYEFIIFPKFNSLRHKVWLALQFKYSMSFKNSFCDRATKMGCWTVLKLSRHLEWWQGNVSDFYLKDVMEQRVLTGLEETQGLQPKCLKLTQAWAYSKRCRIRNDDGGDIKILSWLWRSCLMGVILQWMTTGECALRGETRLSQSKQEVKLCGKDEEWWGKFSYNEPRVSSSRGKGLEGTPYWKPPGDEQFSAVRTQENKRIWKLVENGRNCSPKTKRRKDMFKSD